MFFFQNDLVMHAYILCMSGPGNQTHYPGVARAMLYQMSYRGPERIMEALKVASASRNFY